MFKCITDCIYNAFFQSTPLDEKEKHQKSENHFKKQVKLTYENAINELNQTFFCKAENSDLLNQILGNKTNLASRKLMHIFLDKEEGNIYVHINNTHSEFENQIVGVVHKSHFENNQMIWEVFCNVELKRMEADKLHYIDPAQPCRLYFETQGRWFKLRDFGGYYSKKFYSINKHKTLNLVEIESDFLSYFATTTSPLYVKVNIEHVKDNILSRRNPIKNSRRKDL